MRQRLLYLLDVGYRCV